MHQHPAGAERDRGLQRQHHARAQRRQVGGDQRGRLGQLHAQPVAQPAHLQLAAAQHRAHGVEQVRGRGAGAGELGGDARGLHQPGVGLGHLRRGRAQRPVAVEIREIAVPRQAGVEHRDVAPLQRPVRGRRDHVAIAPGRGGAGEIRDLVGPFLKAQDLEAPEDLREGAAGGQDLRRPGEGAAGDGAGGGDLLDLRLGLHHPQGAHQPAVVAEPAPPDPLRQRMPVGERHPQQAFAPHRHADPRVGRRPLGQRRGQQRDAVVGIVGRGPGPHVVDPGRPHQLAPDRGDRRRRLAPGGDHQEPGPGRALPEAGEEAGDPADLGFGGQQEGVEALGRHGGLDQGQAGAMLGLGEAAGGLLGHGP